MLCFVAGTAFAQPSFVKDSLDGYVNREMKRWKIPAVAVAIVKDGKVVVCKGYGTTESNGTKKVDENTLFQIASNSKAFTGTSLAMLDVRKKISLDDKANKWLPYFALKDEYASKETTVRDLLCHRIGFQTFQSDFLNWNCNLSREEIIKNMKNVTPQYSFRARWGYNNAAFLAAGQVIKAATDTTWDDFVKYNFFVPLEMTRSTTYQKDIVKDNNAAVPYTYLQNKMIKLDYANVDNLGPAASISSCVKDMSNWVICQLDSGKYKGKQVIPFAAIRETRTPQSIVSRGGDRSFPSNHFNLYGLGWGIHDYFGKAMYEHTGGTDGFVTSVCLFPEEKLGIIVFTNTDVNSLFLDLRKQIMAAYFNQPYVNYSAKDFGYSQAGDEEAMAQYKEWESRTKVKDQQFPYEKELAGKYTNDVYGDIEVKKETKGYAVYFSHHPQAKGMLTYMGNDEYLCEYTYATWGIQPLKVKVENGKIKSLVVKINDFVDYMYYDFVRK